MTITFLSLPASPRVPRRTNIPLIIEHVELSTVEMVVGCELVRGKLRVPDAAMENVDEVMLRANEIVVSSGMK
jgi:hypothetical protein